MLYRQYDSGKNVLQESGKQRKQRDFFVTNICYGKASLLFSYIIFKEETV